MKSDYCHYPPQIAADVEITEQGDGERLAHIIGSASMGRYVLLRPTEYQVLCLLERSHTPAAVCEKFRQKCNATLSIAALTRFLTKLDELGILAGERAQVRKAPPLQLGTQFYTRFKLFNPERLFTRVIPVLRWIWTTEFFGFTAVFMLAVVLFALTKSAEIVSYGMYAVREHYLMIVIAGTLVGFAHEFAHGLTCKAFGGRATEVGALLIYYFLPALYCNVSGIHLIPKRGRRLWVIAAGMYWQVLVGALALLAWFILEPYTLLADVAFAFFLGSVVDVVFNANPLIKLDGYYFLSQWLRLPNLMDRSRAYWRRILCGSLLGERHGEAADCSRRESCIYTIFGLLSFVYTLGLRVFIVWYVGAYLMNWFHLLGLLLAAALALFYARQSLGQLVSAAASMMTRLSKALCMIRWEAVMATNDQTASAAMEDAHEEAKTTGRSAERWRLWRRSLLPSAICLLPCFAFLMPWTASVGNYGTLAALPGQEAIIRAPENATLIALQVQPGQRIARGAVIGYLGNLELEEQLTQVQAELARIHTDYYRVVGELRSHEESAARAQLQLRQRQRDYDEIDSEQRQINDRRAVEAREWMIASTLPVSLSSPRQPAETAPKAVLASYPAAIAFLQAEIDLRRARLEEAQTQLHRTRHLSAQGLVPRSELDAAQSRASALAIEQAAARDRLEAALIEHRRKHTTTATEMQLARSDAEAAVLQIEKLKNESQALQALVGTLEERRNLLERKHAQFELAAPRAGSIFGEDLPRMVGQYFQKGAEICRVAETRQLLVRIQVPEREIGDVRLGQNVRLKVRAYPDRTFRGVAFRIGSVSESDEHHQVTYRVEMTIENADGLLRPGMTAFARIDFSRQSVGSVLLHKLRQALRPELWML